MAASTPVEPVFDVESFIHDYYDAWGGTNLDLIMSFYSENVMLQVPGTLMQGKEAVRDQFAQPFITAFPGNRHLVKSMIFGRGVVNVEFSFEAEHKGPFAGHAATGARITLLGCGVYEYDAVKRQITAGRIYFDVGTLLQTITDSLVGDRDKAEETLRTNEHNLSLITNVVPTFIHVLCADGSVLYANQAVLGYTGLTLQEVRKADYRARFFHLEDIERLREERREALAQPVPFENEQRILGKDGKYRWFLVRYNPLLDERGRIERWYVAAFDIEDRKQLEDFRTTQARQSGVRAEVSVAFSKPTHLGEILRGCTEAVVRHLDAAFARIWMLNKDESMLELQASAGLYTRLDGSYSRIPVGDLKVGRIALEKTAHLTNDVMNDPGVNDKGWAQYNGMVAFAGYPLVVEERVIGVVALFARRPLSESTLDTLASVADTIAQGIERKRAETALQETRAELERVTRVTTMGELAATIAHEINQPLAGVVTSANAGLNWLAANPPNLSKTRETLERILRDGTRGGEVLARIRAWLKRTPPAKTLVSVNQIVRDVLALTAEEVRQHQIELSLELAPTVPVIPGDTVQLQQVLLNLIKNAAEAMSGVMNAQRTLRILSRPGELDGKPAAVVEVTDTGVGFSSSETTRLFEAFHTTKPQGMGMGLWISRSIIESHCGRLTASPNDGPGATFVIMLPKASQDQA